MRVSRNFSTVIQTVLDDYVPPKIRDSRLFMTLPLKFVFKDKAAIFLDFKSRAHSMTDEEFSDIYKQLSGSDDLQGETDLNRKCKDAILDSIMGKSVLEVGCGRAYLASKLADVAPTTACDIVIPKTLQKKHKNVNFVEASIEKLPFKNNSFDTVVCTHTLEHVQNLPLAISELRRVTKKRLIIVVPKQRPYNHNFSLHINFFSHDWSFPSLLGYHPNSSLVNLGDWLYIEEHSK